MRLSMWILADWLAKYHPVIQIENGEQVLRSARILSSDTKIEPQNVYLTPAKEFISGEGDKVLCVHGHDILLLDTQDMDLVLNDVFDAFDYYNSWSDGLSNDIENGCSIQHLVDASDDIFNEPLLVFDAGHMLTAHTTRYGVGEVDAEWDIILQTKCNSLDILNKMKEHLQSTRFHRGVIEINLPYFSMSSLQRMLFQGPTVMGRIILLEFHKAAGQSTFQLLDTLGTLLELWLTKTQEKQQLRAECEIFKEMLEQKSISKEALDHKLSMIGWKEEHQKQLFQIVIPVVYKDITYPLLSRLEQNLPDCYVFLHMERIYILANLFYAKTERICQELNSQLRRSIFYCGVSYTFEDILSLREADEQCQFALHFAREKRGGIYYCQDYALDYIKDVLCTQVKNAAVHPALPLLKKYDKKTGNSLYETLYQYLIHNCNLAHTAKSLNLHRNSLLYRLHKIQELTGLDLDECELREYLYLSYIIYQKS